MAQLICSLTVSDAKRILGYNPATNTAVTSPVLDARSLKVPRLSASSRFGRFPCKPDPDPRPCLPFRRRRCCKALPPPPPSPDVAAVAVEAISAACAVVGVGIDVDRNPIFCKSSRNCRLMLRIITRVARERKFLRRNSWINLYTHIHRYHSRSSIHGQSQASPNTTRQYTCGKRENHHNTKTSHHDQAYTQPWHAEQLTFSRRFLMESNHAS